MPLHAEQSAKYPEVTLVSGSVPIRTTGELTVEHPFTVGLASSNSQPAHTMHLPGVGQTSQWLTERAAHAMADTGSEYGSDVVVTAAPNHQKFADRDLRRDPQGFREVVKDRSAQRASGILKMLKDTHLLAPDAKLTGHSLGGMDLVEMLKRNPDIVSAAVAFVDYAGMTAMSEWGVLTGLAKSSLPYDRANNVIGFHAGNEWVYDKTRLKGQSMKLVTDNKTNRDIALLLAERPDLAVTLVASRDGKFQTSEDVSGALLKAELEAEREGRPVRLLARTVLQEGGHRSSATKDGAAQAVSVIEHISGDRQLPPLSSL